ncbi:MAG: cyclic nucleotide-binding domain-containing protein [Nitrospinae bacterium]|nr:cyclic nucleotide-binding domain-containing protein [Nitrospinota bacterium]
MSDDETFFINVEEASEEEGPSLVDRLVGALETDSCAPEVQGELLSRLPFFDSAYRSTLAREFATPDDFWKALASLGDRATGRPYLRTGIYRSGQVIARTGERDNVVFWLLTGGVDIYVALGGERRRVNESRSPGECFGELTILLDQGRTADVIAAEPAGATLLEVDWAITTFPALPEIGYFFYTLMSRTEASKMVGSYAKPIRTAQNAAKLIRTARSESQRLGRENERLKQTLRFLGVSDATFQALRFDAQDRLDEASAHILLPEDGKTGGRTGK